MIAKNIANANVVQSKDGSVYRRQDVVFETILDDAADGVAGGVRVVDTLGNLGGDFTVLGDR